MDYATLEEYFEHYGFLAAYLAIRMISGVLNLDDMRLAHEGKEGTKSTMVWTFAGAFENGGLSQYDLPFLFREGNTALVFDLQKIGNEVQV